MKELLAIFFVVVTHLCCAQDDYDIFIALASDSCSVQLLDEISLEDGHSWKESILLLDCFCTVEKYDAVQALTCKLQRFNFSIEEVLALSPCMSELLSDEPALSIHKSKVEDICGVGFQPNGDLVELIEQLYKEDQSTRVEARLANDFQAIGVIDSINRTIVIDEILWRDSLSTQLGWQIEQKLYILLLHVVREATPTEFGRIKNRLLQLHRQKQFDGRFIANIIDERLRYTMDQSYPLYNYLRSETLGGVRDSLILENRRSARLF